MPHLSFEQICALPFKEQAVWVLNGFWDQLHSEAETIYSQIRAFTELDAMVGSPLLAPGSTRGSALDKMMAAKFLERAEQTLTARQRQAALREIDENSDGQMAAIEYLLYRYKSVVGSAAEIAAGQQGKANEIEACGQIIDQTIAVLPDVKTKLAAQRQAKREVVAALGAIRSAKLEAETSTAKQAAAEEVLLAALHPLEAAKRQLSEAVDELVDELERTETEIARLGEIACSADGSVGVVRRGMAANKLAGLKEKDSMPIRKAKVSQEAALRIVQRREKLARAAADTAAASTVECKAKFAELEIKEDDGEYRRRQLDGAVAELEQTYAKLSVRMAESHAALEELKQDTCGIGALWWMERDLYHADESLPTTKQQFDHTKPFEFQQRPTLARVVDIDNVSGSKLANSPTLPPAAAMISG